MPTEVETVELSMPVRLLVELELSGRLKLVVVSLKELSPEICAVQLEGSQEN